MSLLYVLGARQRNLLFRQEEEWNLYEAALILEIDTESGEARTCVEYRTPSEARAHELSSSIFKSGTLVGDTLYACTNTEVLVFKLPQFALVNYISLPCFNDVHHVAISHDGTLLAVSTGLDMVVRVSPDGKILDEWDVLQEPLWQRFSREIDYRKVASTKPHRSHPNFVFELGREVWATRFYQKDAICLTDPSKRLAIVQESPHDGLLAAGKLHFTMVDGRLVVADPVTLTIDRIVDFKTMDDPNCLLGWCRGVAPVDKEKLWVGFTRVRKTRLLENVVWVKRVFKEGMTEKPTHISLYDTAREKCVQEIDLEQYGMNIVFSMFPVHR
jgi:hypothetical protein